MPSAQTLSNQQDLEERARMKVSERHGQRTIGGLNQLTKFNG